MPCCSNAGGCDKYVASCRAGLANCNVLLHMPACGREGAAPMISADPGRKTRHVAFFTHADVHHSFSHAGGHRGGAVSARDAGGAGMWGMLRIQTMTADFMAHEFKEVGTMGDLRAVLGAIRQHEKDMIIQYEKPEAVKQAHTQWLASLEDAKKVANRFLEGAEDEDNAIARGLVQRLPTHPAPIAPVGPAAGGQRGAPAPTAT